MEKGFAVERSIRSGEKHFYQIELAAGECVRIGLQQIGIDAVAALLAADGRKILQTDLRPRGYATGGILWLAPEAGVYRVEIAANELKQLSGRYRMSLIEKRGAAESDPVFFSEYQKLKQIESEASTCLSFSRSNDRDRARACYQGLQAIEHTAGNKIGEAEALVAIGDTLFVDGRFQTALQSYQRALALYREMGDRRVEALLLAGISLCQASLGDYRKARRLGERALTLATERQDERVMRTALTALGSVETFAGDKQLAVSLLERALALEAYLPISFENHDAVNALVMDLRAHALLFKGDYRQAEAAAKTALQAHMRSGMREGRAYCYVILGSIYLNTGKVEQARQSFAEAVKDLAAWRHPSVQLFSLSMMADLARRQGNLPEAARLLGRAHQLLNDTRFQLSSPDWRAFYSSAQRYLNDEYLQLLIDLHSRNPEGDHLREAVRLAEHERARSLIELLAERRYDLLERISPELATRERDLRLRISEQAFTQSRGKNPLSPDLDSLLDEYGRLQAEIRQQTPQYAALVDQPALSLAELQREVLDADTLLLEYAGSHLFLISRQTCEVFSLPGRGMIEQDARRLYQVLEEWGMSRVFASKQAQNQWELRQQRAFNHYAAALGQKLLAPVADRLGEKRLLIVGDGALQYIPFAALPDPSGPAQPAIPGRSSIDDSQPLLVRHEIITLPSASTLAYLRRNFAGRPLAPKQLAILADPVFGKEDERATQITDASPEIALAPNEPARVDDFMETEDLQVRSSIETGSFPRLPYTRLEAEAILAMTPGTQSRMALGFAADRALATSRELGQHRYIHFATHGILDTERPELSGLVFSLLDRQGRRQNGFLRALDVYPLHLPAELVVLSGCRTGLGKEVSGEGLIGLTRGFMYAGARRVMASLWSVSDRATAELMKRFYRQMLGGKKLAPAAALRAAQIEMRQTKRWHGSYHWAAFVLQGEW